MRREEFKRQKIPDGLVPVVCVEPIVVPERFKVCCDESEKEAKKVKQRKESIIDKFAVKTSELEEIQEVINGH